MEAAGKYSGVIVAGGAGRRMGGCWKGGLVLGGRSFVSRVADGLEDFQEKCLSVKDKAQLPEEERRELLTRGFKILEDRPGDEGPLAGLWQGLTRTGGEGILAVAADTPLFDRDLARQLCALAQGQRDWDACLCRLGGRDYPLCAVYKKSCLPVIGEQLGKKEFRVTAALERLRTGFLELPEGDLRLFNVNRPKDYERLGALGAAGTEWNGARH